MSCVASSARKGSGSSYDALLDGRQSFQDILSLNTSSSVSTRVAAAAAVAAAAVAAVPPKGRGVARKVLVRRQQLCPSQARQQQLLHSLARWFQRVLAHKDACIRKIWTLWVRAESVDGVTEQGGAPQHSPPGGWDKLRMLHTVVLLYNNARAVFRQQFHTWWLLTRSLESERQALLLQACAAGRNVPGKVRARIAAVEEELAWLWQRQQRPSFSRLAAGITVHELRLAYGVEGEAAGHACENSTNFSCLQPPKVAPEPRRQLLSPTPARARRLPSIQAAEMCAAGDIPLRALKAAEQALLAELSPTSRLRPEAEKGEEEEQQEENVSWDERVSQARSLLCCLKPLQQLHQRGRVLLAPLLPLQAAGFDTNNKSRMSTTSTVTPTRRRLAPLIKWQQFPAIRNTCSSSDGGGILNATYL